MGFCVNARVTLENVLAALLIGTATELLMFVMLATHINPGGGDMGFWGDLAYCFHLLHPVFGWLRTEVIGQPRDSWSWLSLILAGWTQAIIMSWVVVAICRKLARNRETRCKS